MAKYMEIRLEKRGVGCEARLLEDEAPETCAVVWANLPQVGDAFHATYARNEVYTMVTPFADPEPPLEFPTITPAAGDVCYFPFATSLFSRSFREARGLTDRDKVLDLAIFYDRDNLLLNPDLGFVSCTVFATIEHGLKEMADACRDIWRNGFNGERLAFARSERT
jgi:hypothetical protein